MDPEHLVQEVDLQRIRGVIYRDMVGSSSVTFILTFFLSEVFREFHNIQMQ